MPHSESATDIHTGEPVTLPQSIDAEQALLGAILVDNTCADNLPTDLRSEHFFVPVHGDIYDAILASTTRGMIATPATLKHLFTADVTLDEIGGPDYLNRLVSSVVSVIGAADYAKIIIDLFKRRGLFTISEQIMRDAVDPTVQLSADELIETGEAMLYDLTDHAGVRGSGDAMSLGQALTGAIRAAETAFRRADGLAGVSTYFPALDALLAGLQPSDLVILAGRPSMGKTALATNIAFRAAADNHPVGFFSLEMSAEQLAQRILSQAADIPSTQMRRGDLTDDDFVNLVKVCSSLSTAKLFIDPTPALSIARIHARARRLKRKQNVELIVIDYLQLIAPAGKSNSRVEDVTAITQGLKAIAKDLSLPVIALSQLSRNVEQRTNKRPQLSDLRDSGSIEQDADVVMFVYREEYYLERDKPPAGADMDAKTKWTSDMDDAQGVAEIIVAKQRNGPIGTACLKWDARLTQFIDPSTLPEHQRERFRL